jgi:hypothetical protein
LHLIKKTGCNIGILEYWNTGILEYWNDGIENNGIMKFSNVKSYESYESEEPYKPDKPDEPDESDKSVIMINFEKLKL